MRGKRSRSYAVLLLTALIWGTGFVAQKGGMDYVGPLLFSGTRFLLGAIILVPVVVFRRLRAGGGVGLGGSGAAGSRLSSLLVEGLPAGLLLWAGVVLQQIGIVSTTAGNAGFITSLYIVWVPMFALVSGRRVSVASVLAVLVACLGLYLLSFTQGLRIRAGDGLVLLSSLFWAAHLLYINKIVQKFDAMEIACVQYFLCAGLSLAAALIFEEFSTPAFVSAGPFIVYGGVMSVALAYTLQIYGLRHSDPTIAGIILSFEGVFAAVFGFLFLAELLSLRQVLGAALVLCAVIISVYSSRE